MTILNSGDIVQSGDKESILFKIILYLNNANNYSNSFSVRKISGKTWKRRDGRILPAIEVIVSYIFTYLKDTSSAKEILNTNQAHSEKENNWRDKTLSGT